MRLAVIGAGVIGVTTAYELTEDGHQVTVFERNSTAAENASFANGGLIAPEWIAAQGTSRWQSEQAQSLRSLWRRLRSGKAPVRPNPAPALLALARHSNDRLLSLHERHQLSTDSHQGLMIVWRNEREAAQASSLHAQFREWEAECALLGAGQARELEAALNPETPLHSALVLSAAWSANCRQFTLQLRSMAQQNGCRFEFGTEVQRLETGDGIGVVCASPRQGTERFDGVVLCTGSAGAELLRPMGIRPPLESAVGHSISAPVREPLDAPLSVVLDPNQRVTIARMGQRVRVSSVSPPGGSLVKSAAEILRLYAVLNDWFPGAIRLGGSGSVQEWCGHVASTPDDLPLIGHAGLPGVWLNMGHGMHGWSMACGSARALADTLSGHGSAIDLEPFRPDRGCR